MNTSPPPLIPMTNNPQVFFNPTTFNPQQQEQQQQQPQPQQPTFSTMLLNSDGKPINIRQPVPPVPTLTRQTNGLARRPSYTYGLAAAGGGQQQQQQQQWFQNFMMPRQQTAQPMNGFGQQQQPMQGRSRATTIYPPNASQSVWVNRNTTNPAMGQPRSTWGAGANTNVNMMGPSSTNTATNQQSWAFNSVQGGGQQQPQWTLPARSNTWQQQPTMGVQGFGNTPAPTSVPWATGTFAGQQQQPQTTLQFTQPTAFGGLAKPQPTFTGFGNQTNGFGQQATTTATPITFGPQLTPFNYNNNNTQGQGQGQGQGFTMGTATWNNGLGTQYGTTNLPSWVSKSKRMPAVATTTTPPPPMPWVTSTTSGTLTFREGRDSNPPAPGLTIIGWKPTMTPEEANAALAQVSYLNNNYNYLQMPVPLGVNAYMVNQQLLQQQQQILLQQLQLRAGRPFASLLAEEIGVLNNVFEKAGLEAIPLDPSTTSPSQLTDGDDDVVMEDGDEFSGSGGDGPVVMDDNAFLTLLGQVYGQTQASTMMDEDNEDGNGVEGAGITLTAKPFDAVQPLKELSMSPLGGPVGA